MSREIRFRAWDKRNKEMEYISDLYWFEETGVHDFNGEGSYTQYELMQYTGLKDKSGKEIYEGDILRTVNYFDIDNNPVYLHHEVIYDTDHGTFNAINLNNFNKSLTVNGNCFLYVVLKTPLIEVIGNIYENPELL